MSSDGKRLFVLGTRLARLILHREDRVAQSLIDAVAFDLGIGPPPTLGSLASEQQSRYRSVARRAIRQVDPDVRIAAAAEAVVEVDLWINGPYNGAGTEPTAVDIAREAISRYEAILCKPEPGSAADLAMRRDPSFPDVTEGE